MSRESLAAVTHTHTHTNTSLRVFSFLIRLLYQNMKKLRL